LKPSDHVFNHVSDAELLLRREDLKRPCFVEKHCRVDAITGVGLVIDPIQPRKGTYRENRSGRNRKQFSASI